MSESLRVLLHNVPDHLHCHVVAPGRAPPADAAKQFALRNTSRNQPFINGLLYPIGHRDGPNVTGFPNQIDDCPMVFPALEMVEREVGQLSSSQSTTEQD